MIQSLSLVVSGGLGSAAIQILQMIGVEKIVATSGREASTQFMIDELRLSPEQVIDYRGKGLKELSAEAIAANGGALFDKTLDFVGGEMKRLCFELVDFDGDIVSTGRRDRSLCSAGLARQGEPAFPQVGLPPFPFAGSARSLRLERNLARVYPATT